MLDDRDVQRCRRPALSRFSHPCPPRWLGSQSRIGEEKRMNGKTRRIRSGMLALGVASALIGLVSAGVTTTAARVPGPIESGAGPGWPASLSPSDFVARVSNPWFPLKPGSRYRYSGVKDGTRTIDVVHVTHMTKDILGVKTTVVHDEVSVHGRAEEVTDDYYAQDRHGN